MSHIADSAPLLPSTDRFVHRHLGPEPAEQVEMLKLMGFKSLDELSDRAVPPGIRRPGPLQLPAALTETEALMRLKSIASRNQVYRSFIGMGYYGTVVPPVIQRKSWKIRVGTRPTPRTRPKFRKGVWKDY